MESLEVLVVDDEPDMGEFVSDALEALGHECRQACDKNEFCETFNDGFDVIMLDLFLPDADGIELLRLLSEAKSGAHVIFMSGKDRSILNAAQRLATDQGVPVLGTLQKPFTVDELGALIDRFDQTVSDNARSKRFKPGRKDILKAVAEDRFSLHVSPYATTQDGSICGGEAILRWAHPNWGDIGPERFLPAAREVGAFNELLEMALTRVVAQLGAWNRQGRHMRLSLKVFPDALVEFGAAEKLESLIRSHGVEADQVILGIPETELSDRFGDYFDLLTRLRIKRFNLSIEGFGTGRMSLYQLIKAPFNEVKFDRSVIYGMEKDPEARTFMRVAVMVAHEIGIRVTAPGARDQDLLANLKNIGCDFVQGRAVGEVVEASSVRLMQSRAANLAS